MQKHNSSMEGLTCIKFDSQYVTKPGKRNSKIPAIVAVEVVVVIVIDVINVFLSFFY